MTIQASVIAVTLQSVDNDVLASLNNAIQMWGVVHKANLGYGWALERNLIKETGYPTFELDDMQDALAYEVNRRVAAGTFK